MNIIFRIDASTQLGSGHVMRCMELAERLRNKDVIVQFVSRAHEGNLNNLNY